MGHLFLDFFLFISSSLQFSPNWRVFLAIPQNFLANSLHVQIFISTFAIATISMRSTPHCVEMQINRIRRFAFHVFFCPLWRRAWML